ncbi:MAG: Anthranilate synthase component 1 [Deltaproteobacteria bacterium ADurb.Bin510]|nr:MAG: Anthranilate synthase component 1 [Deltaproteobacteria bacterium ADurb.Bin510]
MQDKLTIIRESQDRGVVVMKRLAIDTLTPVQAYASLVGEEDGFLLESIPGAHTFLGRFSAAPITVAGAKPWEQLPLRGAKLEFKGLPPFIGGYVGYLGYEMVRGTEDLPRPARETGFPDALLGRCDTFVCFDHLAQQVNLLHTIVAEHLSDESARELAAQAFAPLEQALHAAGGLPPMRAPQPVKVLNASLTDQEFKDAVVKAKAYLKAGDIMQVVLSRRLELENQNEPFEIYRRLRHINPSPYLFYLKLADVTLIGSSPEVMVKLEGDEITSLPIAGTRRRGLSAAEDEVLAAELLADVKERAEHLMLLDLARNDVGRVAEPGTVRVVEREVVKHYSHVMHLVSKVTGTKRRDIDNLKVVEACFPCGTVSGAPKVRAMQIIDELENQCRGPYAGAVGYLSFDGNVDTGIAIRTIFMRAGRTYVQAGAGIVWDSEPEGELQEIDNKLKALSAALGGIQ